MKFDCIIMNPPYNKNLHLKILAEAITHLKNDESKVVNLSPVRWLQDPMAKYKKTTDFKRFNKSIIEHILSVDVYNAKECRQMFQAAMMEDLGIYICTQKKHNFRNLVPFYTENFIRKFMSVKTFDKKIEWHKLDGIRVKVRIILPAGDSRSIYLSKCGITQNEEPIINGKLESGLSWQTLSGMNKNKNALPCSIKFNTIDEAKNFISTMKHKFMIFIYHIIHTDMHVNFTAIPWMGDIINPRTGKKGYESEWTDQDFYKFFNITEDEQKIIEETMAKYK